MHGAGNDFVLIDLREQTVDLTTDSARALADRRLGIGCDQLLLLHPTRNQDCVTRYSIRNADGSPAGQCGNGARCIGLYLFLQGEVGHQPFAVESPAGIIQIRRCRDGEFEVDMGKARFESASVPIAIEPEDGVYRLDSPWGNLPFRAASMGNPHALLQVEDVTHAPLSEWGDYLSHHTIFPEGCNIGFAEIISRKSIKLRVYERGAGETLACGSGACAAVAMLNQAGMVAEKVEVFLPGGLLVIKLRESGGAQDGTLEVLMKGPATHVFKGIINNE